MAAKSDGGGGGGGGVMKMKKSDVAFTPLQDSDLGGPPPPGPGPGRYSPWDGLWVLCAAAVWAADAATDAWLSGDYYRRGELWWFGLTLLFLLLGSGAVQVFSFRWFLHDFGPPPGGAEGPGPGGAALDHADPPTAAHMDGKVMSGSQSKGDVTAAPQGAPSPGGPNSTGGPRAPPLLLLRLVLGGPDPRPAAGPDLEQSLVTDMSSVLVLVFDSLMDDVFQL
ncbi:XK-related protein 4-like [Cololabis saira]|uniref:XK-related protein 4-like n=1 Tax=Cololabis saira TaxID=129043 RepID=UPI002AD1D273|nr:XK-related protein 4-like [Cololabis saira]